jgi:hypothetical protein
MVQVGSQEVFVSYSSKDQEVVRSIVNQLREIGVPMWFDETRLYGGEPLLPVIESAIANCKSVLLMASANAFDSGWVRPEVNLAWIKQRPIIPVQLAPVAKVPAGFGIVMEATRVIHWYQKPPAAALAEIKAALARHGVTVEGAASPADLAPELEDDYAIRFLLSYSEDGGRRWSALPPAGGIPSHSQLRALVWASKPCYLLLLVETLDLGERTVELDVFYPAVTAGPVEPGAAKISGGGIWQTVPRRHVLQVSNPEQTSAWRVGLVLQREPPSALLSVLCGAGRPPDSLPRRSPEALALFAAWLGCIRALLPAGAFELATEVALPVETRTGFGLEGRPRALYLEGAAPAVHWVDVRFAHPGSGT